MLKFPKETVYDHIYMNSRIFTVFLLLLWGCGLLTTIASFLELLYLPLSLVLILPLVFLGFWFWQTLTFFKKMRRGEKLLFLLVSAIWFMHFTGVLVPETGFDAVWYHLPIVDQFAYAHRIFYIPEFFQSLNPQFSDLIFLLGYQVGREFGAKCIAFLFGITLVAVSYRLSREFLDRFCSLLIALVISSFQVVAWQSSSFYVDLAKAVWEIAAVWMLVRRGKRDWILAAAFLGASLATKLFSLFLLPVFVWKMRKEKIWRIFLFLFVSLLPAIPFYVFAFQHTGQPFYSFVVHTNGLAKIGGTASLTAYMLERTIALPTSLTQLTLFGKDYMSLLFLIFMPLLILFGKKLWRDPRLSFLGLFALTQYLIWWYVPPLSTRYTISGFIILVILVIWAAHEYVLLKPIAKNDILATIFLSVAINMLPRLFVLRRNAMYIFGSQTKQQYIRQFYDGWTNEKLQIWHHLE